MRVSTYITLPSDNRLAYIYIAGGNELTLYCLFISDTMFCIFFLENVLQLHGSRQQEIGISPWKIPVVLTIKIHNL